MSVAILPAHLAAIRAREFDPAMERHAEQVAGQIIGRVDLQRVRLYGALARHLPQPAAKMEALRGMAGELSTAARGLVPCSRGCDACCHMPTLLIAEEAAVIAQETGAHLATPAQWYGGEDPETSPHNGAPCTFLRQGACSIYARRPLACRLHLHLDRDNTLCRIVPGETIRVPRLDTLAFDLEYVRAFGPAAEARLADIREFFPHGPGPA